MVAKQPTQEHEAKGATVSERDELILRVCLAPADDLPRLIYADWCDGDGQHDRAEFVRVQIGIEGLQRDETERYNDDVDWSECSSLSADWCPNCGDCTCPDPEQSKSDDACPLHSADSKHRCLDAICFDLEMLRERERELKDSLRIPLWDGEQPGITPMMGVVFRRGFADEIACTAQQWLAHGPAIVRQQPITRVVLADKKPYFATFVAGKTAWIWMSTVKWDGRRTNGPDELPGPLWPLYMATYPGNKGHHDTEADANDAASIVALLWARREAGLEATS